MELYKPSVVQEILERYGLEAKKGFGQNFLVDRNILEKIGAAGDLHKEDNVLEVGPGLGTLGAFFAPQVALWQAVELDRGLEPVLALVAKDNPNFQIIFADFLKVTLPEVVGEESYKLIANLPYYITTPILLKVIESRTNWERMVLMVQWEVAKRFSALPGGKDYGSISLFLQFYGQVKVEARVSKHSFLPAPDVDSAVISIIRHREPPVQVEDEEAFFGLIRAGFQQRRKTLVNSLSNAPQIKHKADEIRRVLQECGIDLKARAETLSLQQFAQVYRALSRL